MALHILGLPYRYMPHCHGQNVKLDNGNN